MEVEIKIFSNPEEIAAHIAVEIKNLVSENSKKNLDTFIAVSGGHTPDVLFNRLSESPYREIIEWDKLHLFWCDERCVPPDDKESNFGMTKYYLLEKIDIPVKNIHRILGENDPEKEVKRISGEIKSIVPAINDLPGFDLTLLGVGTDGHTASLFPGRQLKNVSDNIAGIAEHPLTGQKRISLTFDVINNSKEIIFMVTGNEKADIISRIMNEGDLKDKYPAAMIGGMGKLKWFLDKEASLKIKGTENIFSVPKSSGN